jgi:Zinc dependent phospholipase C
MPKERSHWLLARRAADRLQPGPLADAVHAFGEFFLAGAVTHDSPYYALGSAEARRTADRLHGTAVSDSLSPFRALASHRSDLGAQGFAFGWGALTHLAADATFHPMIFSWTGDADAAEDDLRRGWRYRHQACETALDLHFEALWGQSPVRTFAALVHETGPELFPLQAVFSGGDARQWIRAHSRLQRLFDNPLAAGFARVASWWNRRGFGDISGAFYLTGPVFHPAFEGILDWIDPVTGLPGSATLEQLVEQFEALSLSLASQWEKAWTTGAAPFSGQIGLALGTGIPCDKDQRKQYFSAKWF